jgi:hypothetical protein
MDCGRISQEALPLVGTQRLNCVEIFNAKGPPLEP